MKNKERFIDINMILDHPLYQNESSIEALLQRMEVDQVNCAVISPMRPLADFSFSASNDALKKAISGKTNFAGLGTILPHHGPGEVERCIVNLGFKGIRLFPDIHWTILNLRRPLIDPIVEKVVELRSLVYLNTGRSDPWSNPAPVFDLAMRFPDLRIIMGHLWDSYLWPDALVVAQRCKNVFLEVPIVTTGVIRQAVETIGPDRLLAGSGYPESSPAALKSLIDHLGLDEAGKQALLYGNAQALFGFPK